MMEELFKVQYDQYWYPQVFEVPVEQLAFDDNAAEGQIRTLAASAVEDRIKSLRQDPPDDLLDCRLWEADITGSHVD